MLVTLTDVEGENMQIGNIYYYFFVTKASPKPPQGFFIESVDNEVKKEEHFPSYI